MSDENVYRGINWAEERSESRKEAYWRQAREAKLSLYIWQPPGEKHVSVRELESDQLERAVLYFEKRKHECVEELTRRVGEPKPNFWAADREFAEH